MSLRLFVDDVLFTQRLLKAEGLYVGELDGVWGPLTTAATTAFEMASMDIRQELGSFDMRSEAELVGLLLLAQRVARGFLGRLLDAGLKARIISGTRTYLAQNALYRRGRWGNPGPVVTNARGGQSFHNFGVAWDIGLFADDGAYLVSAGPYRDAAQAGLGEGIDWGGNNVRFIDLPHYRLTLPLTVNEVRQRFHLGLPYVPE